FMLMNTGTKPIVSKNNLLTTVAWRIGNRTEYALEGSIFIAGAVVQWLRDGLGIIKSSSEVEALAAQVDDTGGVYLVPAFAGLGVGYWKDQKQIAAQWQVDRRFTHAMKATQRKQLETGWRKALDRARRWEAEG